MWEGPDTMGVGAFCFHKRSWIGANLVSTDPLKVFDDADLMKKRQVIDFFCTVRLYPHPRGRRRSIRRPLK